MASSLDPESILLSHYHYHLPDEQIAKQPLAQRDQSNLLAYQQGEISHHQFFSLPELLPSDSLLLFNDTKVIKARLYFQRKTGAKIEVLLLNPVNPAAVEAAMAAQGTCTWHCIIGNRKRWKLGEEVFLDLGKGAPIQVSAQLSDPERNQVTFRWTPEQRSFVEVLALLGQLPLPPYLKREATEKDLVQYQTVYARQAGAVAAPTAGLHFTDEVLQQLAAKGMQRAFITLHVSAGTFLPVKTDRVMDHPMHAEQAIIQRATLQQLTAHPGPVITVGTTSLRWLESMYWLGAKLLREGTESFGKQPLEIDQRLPYQLAQENLPDRKAALRALLDYLDYLGVDQIHLDTRLLIVPGYSFRMTDGLITNFHLPGTTLILLVAALIGEDWKKVYESALQSDYRFLSYGDSSLLLPSPING
ncbi:MAG: S-adenosylmethionine:tRNA ribosyltransferase-isomerase [Bacteroidota bacterium]